MATEQGFPFWRALGTIFRGWVKVKNGDVTDGISLLRSGLTRLPRHWDGGVDAPPYRAPGQGM